VPGAVVEVTAIFTAIPRPPENGLFRKAVKLFVVSFGDWAVFYHIIRLGLRKPRFGAMRIEKASDVALL
jgi:hypothetical protein